MANHHHAIALTSSGAIDQIELPTPSPAANEVLYEVHYAGLMPADVYQIDKGLFVQEYPSVIGVSSAGYVKAVGEGVTDIKVGDKVSYIPIPLVRCVHSRSIICKGRWGQCSRIKEQGPTRCCRSPSPIYCKGELIASSDVCLVASHWPIPDSARL